MTKTNKWSLTPARERLLETLINPEYLGKNVTELCNLAEISRNSYYKFMGEPEFTELITETSKEMVMGKIGDVLNATYNYALEERGHQDRKMLLQMAGIHADKQETTLTGELDVSQRADLVEKYLKDDGGDEG